LTIEELLEQTYDGYLTNGEGDFWHSVEEASEAIFGEPEEDPLYEFHAESTVYGVERVNFELDYQSAIDFIETMQWIDFERQLTEFLEDELYEFIGGNNFDPFGFLTLKGVDDFVKNIKYLALVINIFPAYARKIVKKIVDRFNSKNQHIWLLDVDTTLQATITNEF
jgi:hypothetical protein